MNSFIFKFFLFEDFCLEDFTWSREDKTIWSERPHYRISPPSTLAWRYPAHHTGSHQTTVSPPSVSPLSSSPSQAHGHETPLPATASPPPPQQSRLNTTFGSTATHNVMAVTSLAITPYAVPTRPAVVGVLVPTQQGTILVPPPPATRRAALAHTPLLSVSHVPALMKHTLPSALGVLPLSPVRGVGRMTRCTSTGRSFPLPPRAMSHHLLERLPFFHLSIGDLSSLLTRFSTACTLRQSD